MGEKKEKVEKVVEKAPEIEVVITVKENRISIDGKKDGNDMVAGDMLTVLDQTAKNIQNTLYNMKLK